MEKSKENDPFNVGFWDQIRDQEAPGIPAGERPPIPFTDDLDRLNYWKGHRAASDVRRQVALNRA